MAKKNWFEYIGGRKLLLAIVSMAAAFFYRWVFGTLDKEFLWLLGIVTGAFTLGNAGTKFARTIENGNHKNHKEAK